MATTMGVRLTHAGQKLLAKVHAGIVDKLELTSIVIGDGIWTEGEIESPDKTKLKSERIRTAVLELTTGTGDNAGRLICSGVLNNITVTKHFYVREIGIMAKDPDDGEILYIIDPVPANAPTTVIEANSVRQDIPVRMELVAVSKDKVELVLSEATSIVTPSQMADAVTDIKAYVDQKTTNINAFTLENKRAADFAAWEHKHPKSEITDFPASLPANGGNADTVGGTHAWQMQTLDEAGNPLLTGHLMYCQWNKDKDLKWRIYVADETGKQASIHPFDVKVDYAESSRRLQTPCKINGVAFDGTRDITLGTGLSFSSDAYIDLSNDSITPYAGLIVMSTYGSGDVRLLFNGIEVGLTREGSETLGLYAGEKTRITFASWGAIRVLSLRLYKIY